MRGLSDILRKVESEDFIGARKQADELDQMAGPHIQFEEEVLYPEVAQSALLHQSRADSHGKAHPDGWGIVCYRGGSPQAERRATAAHEDLWFSMTAERTYSCAVIAHIRKATVGKARLENTHPFTHGCWTFAHNGTVAGFDHIQSELEEKTDRNLLKHRKGTTDSELVFYWLLTCMGRAALAVDELPLRT